MADDWQAGDLALCIRNTPTIRSRYNSSLCRLRVGGVYTVQHVGCSSDGIPVLLLDDVRSDHPDGTFRADKFRKIRPHTPDAEDAETIRLLLGAPVRVDA